MTSWPGYTSRVHVAVDVTLDATGATVDFSRSNHQVPAGLNCYINYTRAYSSFAIRVLNIDVPDTRR